MTQDLKLSERVVAAAQLPEDAQRALEAVALRTPRLREQLSYNSSLAPETWTGLYTRKPQPKAASAVSLVSRTLTKEQRLHVLDFEKRPAVLAALVEHNVLDVDEQQLVLASKGFGPKLAAILVGKSWTDPSLRKAMALEAGGQVLLDFLAGADAATFPTAEAEALLRRYAEWAPSLDEGSSRGKGQRARSLVKLFGRRPDLLSVAVAPDQHSSVVTAAAGSLHLTDVGLQFTAAGLSPSGEPLVPGPAFGQLLTDREYALMALVNNPPTAPEVAEAVERHARAKGMFRLAESASGRLNRNPKAIRVPYDQVADEEALRRLVRRALPNWEYQTKGRPYELAALARNPRLPATDVESIADALDTAYASEVLGDDLLPAFEALLHRQDRKVEWLATRVRRLREGESERNEDWDAYTSPGYSEDRALTQHVHSLAWEHDMNRVLVHVANRLGGSETAWEHFLTLVDEFDGRVEDVVQLSELL